MCIDPLQVHRPFGEQCLGLQIDPEKGAAFVDKFLRDFSTHAADREAHGVHEGALLNPPAESLGEAFLPSGIECAGTTQLLDDVKNEQRVAIELCPDLENRSTPIASRHRRQLGTRRPYRDLDRAPIQVLEAQGQSDLFRIWRKLVVMQNDLRHVFPSLCYLPNVPFQLIVKVRPRPFESARSRAFRESGGPGKPEPLTEPKSLPPSELEDRHERALCAVATFAARAYGSPLTQPCNGVATIG